jgi:hypothetical protein
MRPSQSKLSLFEASWISVHPFVVILHTTSVAYARNGRDEPYFLPVLCSDLPAENLNYSSSLKHVYLTWRITCWLSRRRVLVQVHYSTVLCNFGWNETSKLLLFDRATCKSGTYSHNFRAIVERHMQHETRTDNLFKVWPSDEAWSTLKCF